MNSTVTVVIQDFRKNGKECHELHPAIKSRFLTCYYVHMPWYEIKPQVDTAYKYSILLSNYKMSHHEKIILVTQSHSKGSGKSAHPPSLARAFAVRIYNILNQRKLQVKSHIPCRIASLRMSIWRISKHTAFNSLFSWDCSNYRFLPVWKGFAPT